jgi:hypothetical protein
MLGVRWTGWRIATAGGLCEACRERERTRWDSSPYGEVLVPLPVELGPRWLGRRVVVAVVAGAAAAVVTTAALLVVNPPDLIPSGGQPGYVSSGARLAGPSQAQAEPVEERSAASRPLSPVRAVSREEAPRVVPSRKRAAPVSAEPTVRVRAARTVVGGQTSVFASQAP